jgi:hypothetical protein
MGPQKKFNYGWVVVVSCTLMLTITFGQCILTYPSVIKFLQLRHLVRLKTLCRYRIQSLRLNCDNSTMASYFQVAIV